MQRPMLSCAVVFASEQAAGQCRGRHGARDGTAVRQSDQAANRVYAYVQRGLLSTVMGGGSRTYF